MANEQPRLDGPRVLVVEDVAVLAWQVCDALADASVALAGLVSGVAGALASLAEQKVDAAMLDKNLGDECLDTIADVLIAQHVPFAFLTGCSLDDTQGRRAGRPIIGKPLKSTVLVKTAADLSAERAWTVEK